MEEQVLALQQQVAQRDEMINVMKNKTKEYVIKLKADHQLELDSTKQEVGLYPFAPIMPTRPKSAVDRWRANILLI
jgi:hypothetical protein